MSRAGILGLLILAFFAALPCPDEAFSNTTDEAYFHSPQFGVEIEKSMEPKLNLGMTASGFLQTGDAEETDASANLKAVYASFGLQHNFVAGLDYSASGEKGTPAFLQEWDYDAAYTLNAFFNERIYCLLLGSWKRDAASGVDNSFGARAGLGYFFIESVPFTLRAEIGYQRTIEDFGGVTEDRNVGSAAVSLKSLWKVSATTIFTMEMDHTESMDATDDEISQVKASLAFAVHKGIGLAIKYEYDYDGAPASVDKRKVNTSVGFLLSIEL